MGTNRCGKTGTCAPDRSEGNQDGRDAGASHGQLRVIKYLEVEARGLERDGKRGSLLTSTQ